MAVYCWCTQMHKSSVFQGFSEDVINNIKQTELKNVGHTMDTNGQSVPLSKLLKFHQNSRKNRSHTTQTEEVT